MMYRRLHGLQRIHTLQERAKQSSRTWSSASFALRSKLWIPTEKEVPSDAATQSHQLLIRGGYIRKSGHGLFTFLPLGLRVISKLEQVIDSEMRHIHGNKLELPLLIPVDLWKQSGRWQHRGPELMTCTDRREEIFTLAPTHEESITSLVAHHYTNSNESLRLYQIGRKFRDEIRPRFGLLRAREFIMKDMYSFDTSFEHALETYDAVAHAYRRILLERLKLPVVQVEADSGNIGGNLSHEFHVLAPVGEDALLSCASSDCDYAANVEKACGQIARGHDTIGCKELAEIKMLIDSSHGTTRTLGEVFAAVQGVLSTQSEHSDSIQMSVFREITAVGNEGQEPKRYAIVFCRGDREINPLSLKAHFNGEELMSCKTSDMNDDSVAQLFFDDSLPSTITEPLSTMLPGMCKEIHRGHFRIAREGDICPKCERNHLEAHRGIEVGHVFYLGQKYSQPFEVAFTTHENGENTRKIMEMGCFGMGVTRLIAAAVEVLHDKNGIVWPVQLAPYKVLVMCIGSKHHEDTQAQTAMQIAEQLAQSSVRNLSPDDIVLDDRWNERPGSKLTESELLGYPYRVVVGKKYLKEGVVEVQSRATMERSMVRPDELPAFFNSLAQQGLL